jgi:hypothetical protein
MPRLKPFAMSVALGTTVFLGVLPSVAPAYAQPDKTANVRIVDPLPIPVTVTEKEPFQVVGGEDFSDCCGSSVLVTVPTDRRLVIEHASALIGVFSPGGLLSVSIGVKEIGVRDELQCTANSVTPGGAHFFACSGMTKFYVDPGADVRISVQTMGDAGGFARALISGYYMPVP